MSKLNKILVCLPFSVFSSLAHAATYIDVFNSNASLVLEKDEVQLADVTRPATPCAQREAFVCIKSEGFSIAVPKDPFRKSWTFLGSRYRVLRETDGMFFGALIRYQVISVEGDEPLQFAYSRDRGILALTVKDGGALILNEDCGALVQNTQSVCSN